MEHLGRVSALYRYPIKALGAETLAEAAVDAGGFVGDRAGALIVHTLDNARTGKTYRGKENNRLHTVRHVTDAKYLAHHAGVAVGIEEDQPHYFDAEPVSIVFDAWIHALEALAGRAVDPLQFRPNIVADAAPGFALTEADLIGMRIMVGEVAFDVVSSITRCVTISYDIATGEPDPALQRTIVQQRGNKMGIYCRVVAPGTIYSGATIESAGAATPA